MDATAPRSLETDCCIVGGGPAGIMLGYLLARAGVRVIVLEKHADFLRDFRGDTIHPSTLRVMHALGLLDGLFAIPHQEMRAIHGVWGDRSMPLADFARVDSPCRFIALMPQWDFLDYLSRAAAAYPSFALMMQTEGTALVRSAKGSGTGDDTRVTGVEARGRDGPLTIAARLVVACDGRRSTMRAASKLPVTTLGAPMDVVWFALPRHESDGDPPLGRFMRGAIFVMIDRGDHWQCGYVIAKGSLDALKAQGFDAFRDAVVAALPADVADPRERVASLDGWDDVSLLSVAVDRLDRWALDGLLCIGDAAHAMSPIGGVGINLAIQDAVATANLLAPVLRTRRPTSDELEQVQRRRIFPTRTTQGMQLMIQERVVSRALQRRTDASFEPPLAMRAISRSRWLRQQIGRVLGMGFRPEMPELR